MQRLFFFSIVFAFDITKHIWAQDQGEQCEDGVCSAYRQSIDEGTKQQDDRDLFTYFGVGVAVFMMFSLVIIVLAECCCCRCCSRRKRKPVAVAPPVKAEKKEQPPLRIEKQV